MLRLTGRCHSRRNDREGKLIVVPDEMMFHQAEMGEAVHFQGSILITPSTRLCADPVE